MTISIFGLGYVGCVSLGCLAQNGFKLIGVDISRDKVNLINSGLPTIIEKDIDRIIAEQHKLGNINATEDYRQAVDASDVSIICVGTPSTVTGHLNLDYVYHVAEQIGETLKHKSGFHVVIIRSTVLPGTNIKAGEIIARISGKEKDKDFAVVSNPEFLREGSAVQDYYNPPFTLIGSDNEAAAEIAASLYVKVNGEIIRSSIKAAELLKYVNNSYHALKVTFANEIGSVCKELGIDSHEVMDLFCRDRQLNISPYYFKPGFAYGGSCLPKDLKALNTIAHDLYLKTPVLEAIEASNNNHISNAVRMVERHNPGKIGVLGIAFKEGTDDLRYSPIISLIEYFNGKGAQIRLHDDYVNAALVTGSNREYLNKHLPYLEKMMRQKEESIVKWADLIIINRKKQAYEQMIRTHHDKFFIDLVMAVGEKGLPNLEHIC